MSGSVTTLVFQNRHNQARLQFRQRDPIAGTTTDLDTSLVTRAVLTLPETSPEVKIDSQVSPSSISWNSTGLFTLQLGDHSIPTGSHVARLTVLDAAGDETELVHENAPSKVVIVYNATSTI